jgi:hypothetical protein
LSREFVNAARENVLFFFGKFTAEKVKKKYGVVSSTIPLALPVSSMP